MDLELKPLPDNLEYVFLEEPSFLPVIISSKLSAQNKSRLNLPFELMCDGSDFAVGAVLEFDIEIKDRKGTENVAADHLSQIENEEICNDSEVDENFPGETLMKINTRNEPWFADFANYLVADIIPKGMTYQQKNKFFSNLKHYFWEEPYIFKNCNPDLIAAGEKRMFQLHKLDKLRHQAYENSRLYKARIKFWHDRKLRIRKEFKHRNKVLLFHSKYKFKQPTLRSRWLGPYVVKHQYPSGYVELYGKDGKHSLSMAIDSNYITKKKIIMTKGKQSLPSSPKNDSLSSSLANDSLKN
ncbi:hypothetical protein Tco_1568956 [Tanacetum coccineum]